MKHGLLNGGAPVVNGAPKTADPAPAAPITETMRQIEQEIERLNERRHALNDALIVLKSL